ncbi:MAG: FkbM family methyltransferase [Agathobacter sp.]|nr:FkbM family methyltransferase [Agathobacter sp.]
MKVNKIVMGTGVSQYGVLNNFTERLAEGFRKCGVKVDIVDLNELEQSDSYIKCDEYDMFFSFNSLFTEPGIELITNNKNVLIWSYMVDHPYSLDTQMLENRRYHIVSCVDRKHVKYLDEFYYNNQWRCFMPHGGTVLDNDITPLKENDVSILGSIQVEVIDEFKKKTSEVNDIMRRIICNIVDLLIYDNTQTLDGALKNELMHYEIELQEEEFRILVGELNYIDAYVRLNKRVNVVKFLVDNGIAVHVYGKGWKELNISDSENLFIHDMVEYEQALEIISKSKIVVNIMPLFTDGSHERVLDTMGQKTICFSDKSIFLEENFEDEREIFFYSMQNLPELVNKVKKVLACQYDVEGIIKRAYQKVCSFHTWDKRAQEVLDFVNTINIPKKVCETENVVDIKFEEISNYFENEPYDTLFNKMKANYYEINKLYPDYADGFKRSFNTYKFWGTWNPSENDFGVLHDRLSQIKEHWLDFKNLYSWLSDYTSKNILIQILRNWETLNGIYFENVIDKQFEHYFDLDLIKVSKDEVFVDLGAYIGDTVSSYINTFGENYKKIYCYEFNNENVNSLRKITANLSNIEIRECAVGGENGYVSIRRKQNDNSATSMIIDSKGDIPMVTLDDDIDEKITFIKSDIEGAEISMLMGAKKHIKNDHPKLAISVYHGNSDIWEIPKIIHEIDSSYSFYLRYYGGCLYPNEIVLYAV